MFEDEYPGVCKSCGFLGLFRKTITGGPFEAPERIRKEGNLPTDARLFCFRRFTDLQRLVEIEEGVSSRSNAVLQTITVDLGCDRWFPWTEGFTPKEHLEEYKMQQLEDRRERFERYVFQRTQFWAFMQVVVAVTAILVTVTVTLLLTRGDTTTIQIPPAAIITAAPTPSPLLSPFAEGVKLRLINCGHLCGHSDK